MRAGRRAEPGHPGSATRTGRRRVAAGRPARARRPIEPVTGGAVRLTSRGRAVLVGSVATILLVGLWLTAGRGAQAGSDDDKAPGAGRPAETVVVGPDDTLWDVAVRDRPEADPRITVQRIMDVNGLADPVVQPGQRLRMPR